MHSIWLAKPLGYKGNGLQKHNSIIRSLSCANSEHSLFSTRIFASRVFGKVTAVDLLFRAQHNIGYSIGV